MALMLSVKVFHARFEILQIFRAVILRERQVVYFVTKHP